MKTLHKLVLVGAAVAGAITVMREVRRMRFQAAREKDLPTLLPAGEAETRAQPESAAQAAGDQDPAIPVVAPASQAAPF